MFADALSSVAVVVGAVLIRYTGFTLLDPLLTFIIGGYVLFESFKLLSSSIRILMQVAPPDLDIYEIKHAIESIPGIRNVHHIHLWSLSDVEVFFEAHVESEEDITLSSACKKIGEIEDLLKKKFGISHTTIQFEYEACEDKSVIRRRKRSG
jgi:cobalt-zinc-cadmium efflux system protein